jgi:hypothetical protein
MPLVFASLLLAPAAFGAENCAADALPTLKNQKAAIDLRTQAGICLVKTSLGKPEVAQTVLKIIRSGQEDLFLREDLIEALGAAPLRRTEHLKGGLAPEIGKEEKENLDRTLASRSASSLKAVAQAVKSMDEILPVTKFEREFFRVLGEIARDENNHVLLRATAVGALEKMSMRVVESGVYEEKMVHLSQETLRQLAAHDDSASYYSGAIMAYERLAAAGIPGFVVAAKAAPNRTISSVQPAITTK